MSKYKKRQLKIYSKFKQNSGWNSKLVPEIRLCGKWLEEMGFDYGDRITVRLEEGRLIIEPEGELRKNPQLTIWN
ncbi:SymE family type I addiction module toxin [Dyadobacter sandarakinus]|uniref:Type I addiction module toxin, SymE family n=1 Tax=Dyadobacter sandarakinus TaxID=2747268 RepID=A0ABX7IBQ0_9BACT|nr:SymE family type I addiction module toxin [Dyadobacter sandarakinus]QRR03551.1 type I addiction module toxin, SymE family [Dyadobacter sandarakinus]